MDGPPAADLRHPLPRRRAVGREVDRHRERDAVLPRAPARALGVEPVLGGSRHRARVVPGQGVRGPADRGPARPSSTTGPTSSSSCTRSSPPRRSRRSARCGGTCARTRTSAPSSCASATRCRRCARSPRSARSCSASCTGSTPRSTRTSQVYIPREWTIRQNKWLAARYGLDAKLIVDDEGTRVDRPRRRSASSSTTSTPIAARARLRRRARGRRPRSSTSGPSYVRQRAVGRAGRRPRRRRARASSTSSPPTSRGPVTTPHVAPGRSTAALDAFLDGHLEELIAFRRELHAHPELSNEEHETTARVARAAAGRRPRRPGSCRAAPG